MTGLGAGEGGPDLEHERRISLRPGGTPLPL